MTAFVYCRSCLKPLDAIIPAAINLTGLVSLPVDDTEMTGWQARPIALSDWTCQVLR